MNESGQPVVSVCIANYNGVAFIGECIESVINQVDAPPFEIIVHDDASTDQSLEIIQSHPSVRTIASERNVGFCVSNNRMAAIARGEYLLLLNNDAVLNPDALQALVVSSRSSSDDPILSLTQYDYETNDLLDRGFLLDPFFNPIPVSEPSDSERAMVMGSCLWISHKLWQRIGGFPELMESIGEDLYLCCYARLLGEGVRVLPDSGYRHRVGRSFGGGKVRERRLETTIRRRALSERNKIFVLMIFLPLPLLFLIAPLHAIFLISEGAVLATWHKNPRLITQIYIAAMLAPFRRRVELKLLRREAQRARTASWSEFLAPMIWTPWKLRLLLRHGFPSVH